MDYCSFNITSSLNIVAYEPELKSLIAISVVLALTVKSFSNDKTNLAAHQSNKISKLIHERED